MEILIYSREGCDVCNRFKKRVKDLGFDYTSRNIDEWLDYREDFRETKSYEIWAALQAINDGHYPVIKIDEEYHSFASAMKKLKEAKNSGQSNEQRNIGAVIGEVIEQREKVVDCAGITRKQEG